MYVTDPIPSITGMSDSTESDRVILAAEEYDQCSGQSQTRKSRSKPARSGFNCLGFIPVTVLNQRKTGNGLRRGARLGLQFVRELTCRHCTKNRISPPSPVFVAHKRVGLQIHIGEKHRGEELLLNSSQKHHQRKLNSSNYAVDSKEIERYDYSIVSRYN